jgi:hypothetical protein
VPVTTEPATWISHPPGWPVAAATTRGGNRRANLRSPDAAPETEAPQAEMLAPPLGDVRRFSTFLQGLLRTCGLVLTRPGRRAADLSGLDVAALTALAAGVPGAPAGGKLLMIGSDGGAVFQTKPGLAPELVFCANGAPAFLMAQDTARATFDMFGPAGKVVRVAQRRRGPGIAQTWALPGFEFSEHGWRGRRVLKTDALNSYAVLLEGLPPGIDPHQARRELVGDALTAKLAVITTGAAGGAQVAFYNAHGRHGAAPATGLAVIAVLSERSPPVARALSGGLLTYVTSAGPFSAPLLGVEASRNGAVTVTMPTVETRLTSLGAEVTS